MEAGAVVLLRPSYHRRLSRLLFRSLLWLFRLAPFAAMIGMLHAFSAPGCYFFEALCFVLLSLFLSAVWLLRLGFFMLRAREERRFRPAWKESWRRWAFGPAMVLFTLTLLYFQVPFRVRFAISRNALDRLAQAELAKGPREYDWYNKSLPVHRAGAFVVIVTRVTPAGEVDFYVPGTEFIRSFQGLSYAPNSTPFDPEGSFEPIDGGWYKWSTSW